MPSPFSRCRFFTTTLTLTGLLFATTFPAHAANDFNTVRNTIFGAPVSADTNKIAQEQAIYEQDLLPHYPVNLAVFLAAGVNQLARDSHRTLANDADVLPRLDKLVHRNGICFSGVWQITEDNQYSGYFSPGSQGLFIGRASTALSATERGKPRAFGFAGKLFPTMDPDEVTETANFFTIDVLMGTQRPRFMDVKLTNQPETGFRFSVLGIGLAIATAFSAADKNPGFRPLYPIAELGLAEGEESTSPRFLMLQTDVLTPRNNDIDFRHELDMERNELDNIRLNILVSNSNANKNGDDWQAIGHIDLAESAVSYGCDRQLHFSHPKAR